MQDFPESGKIIKFSELDSDIQKAFFAINEDVEKKGFLFFDNPMSRKGIKWLCLIIVIGSTLGIFLTGILSNKISFLEILKWTVGWFIFIAVLNLSWAYSQYKKTAVGSGYLLTDKYFIFFLNNDLVKLLPLTTLSIIEGKDGFIFKSGEVSFEIKYEYCFEKALSKIFAEIMLRSPQFEEVLKLERFGRAI